MNEILVNGHTFKVNVIIKKRNKRIYMRVKQGYIEFTTPVNLTDARIKEIISNNMNLVLKNINPKEKSDEYIHYLGQKYNLILKQSISNFVYISDNDFIVEYTNEKYILKNIVEFYKKGLTFIVDRYKDEIFKKFNLKDINVFYVYVKTFFGKCYPRNKRICLNVKLAKYDIKYILSVIYHECAHFKIQNHQEEYYKYLESIYPNYRKVQKELRSIKFNEKY